MRCDIVIDTVYHVFTFPVQEGLVYVDATFGSFVFSSGVATESVCIGFQTAGGWGVGEEEEGRNRREACEEEVVFVE